MAGGRLLMAVAEETARLAQLEPRPLGGHDHGTLMLGEHGAVADAVVGQRS